MKFLSMILVLTASTAFAEVPTIRASKVTCQSLKETLEKYGTIRVKKKSFLFTSHKLVTHKATCSAEQTLVLRYFKTLDNPSCQAGEVCKNPAPTYSDSGSDSGWSSSGNDWGSSSDSGSDRGPSYDPPSSGDRGSSYDPPDSGDRGPSYCPGC